MADPFTFDWPVDQDGYVLNLVAPEEREADLEKGVLLAGGKKDQITAKGGPLRYYRPLENEGLWRRFGETCISLDGVMRFVSEFGLLFGERDNPHSVLEWAEQIRNIAARVDKGDRQDAADLLNERPPSIVEILAWNDRGARFETRLVPYNLRDALRHQAAETISGNRRWRRCRKEGCPQWFRLGSGASTERREFCSDRCRVASARSHKHEGGDRHA